MKYEQLTEEQVHDSVRSAGKNFLAAKIGDMLGRIPQLENSKGKKEVIKEYFEQQEDFTDKGLAATKTRVYSALRVIRSAKVHDVLKMIMNSEKVSETAKKDAKATLDKIDRGLIPLPALA